MLNRESMDDDPFEFMHRVNRMFSDRKLDFNLLSKNYLLRKEEKLKEDQAYIDMSFLMGYIAHKYNMRRNGDGTLTLGQNTDNPLAGKDAFSLAMFATWRLKPHIYEIDTDLFEQVQHSPLPYETPSLIFNNLPAWAVYIKLKDHHLNLSMPDGSIQLLKCHGFWAYKVYMDSKVWVLIYPHISQDEIDKTTNIKNYMPTSFFIIDSQYNLLESLHYGSSRILDEKQVKNLRPDIWDMHINNSRLYLSLLLLLCIESPQIEDNLGHDVDLDYLRRLPSVQPKTKRFIAPDKPSIFHVGRRLGGEIRGFKRQLELGSPTLVSMKPHIRQAHWHCYRYGEGRKQFKLKFLAPIFVNMASPDNLEDTKH